MNIEYFKSTNFLDNKTGTNAKSNWINEAMNGIGIRIKINIELKAKNIDAITICFTSLIIVI